MLLGNKAITIYDELISICNENKRLEFLTEEIKAELYFCHTCHSYIKNKKLPIFNKYNQISPGEIPLEISLISQIRPYMKIYSLKKSSKLGQFAFKGNVTHFAQCVEEISEQLPLTTSSLETIIVTESLEGLKEKKILKSGQNIYIMLSFG